MVVKSLLSVVASGSEWLLNNVDPGKMKCAGDVQREKVARMTLMTLMALMALRLFQAWSQRQTVALGDKVM